MSVLRVLSVDWDFFVDAAMSVRMSEFPDGGNENLPSQVRNVVWAGRYVNGNLDGISAKSELDDFVDALQNSILDAPPKVVWVVDSHKHLYDVVLKQLTELGKDSIQLVNIDFHHDVYDLGGNEIDCGNWLRYVARDFYHPDNDFLWIGQEDSEREALDVFNRSSKTTVRFSSDLDSASIADTKWDVVYICRSDMWSPPHLDDSFVNTLYESGIVCGSSYPVMGERAVLENRMDEIREIVDSEKELMAKIRREYEEAREKQSASERA